MNSRNEPRLKTETPASIQVLRDRAQEFEGIITDTSTRGLCLIAKEPLTEREVVRICTETHYVFVMVRHCIETDKGHQIGVERIDDWHSKANLAEDGAIPNAPANVVLPKPKSYLGDLETLAIKDLFENDNASAPAKKRPSLSSATVVGAAIGIVVLVLILIATTTGSRLGLQASESPGVSSTPEVQAAQPVAPAPVEAPVAAPANPVPPPAVTPPVVQAPVVQAPVVQAPVVQAKVAPPAVQPPAATPASVPSGAQHSFSVSSSGNSWVMTCADGKKVFEKLLQANSVERISFSNQALLRSGNPGVLSVVVDSQPLDGLKGSLKVRAWKFKANGGPEEVAPSLYNSCDSVK